MGKCGAGKSSLAGTFARVLAGTGERVLALDSDPMPGLAFALGIDRSDEGLPDEAVEGYDDNGRRRYRLRDGLSGTGAVEQYAIVGPTGVRFLQLGKHADGGGTTHPSTSGFSMSWTTCRGTVGASSAIFQVGPGSRSRPGVDTRRRSWLLWNPPPRRC